MSLAQQDFAASLYRNLPFPVIVTDRQGNTVSLNEAAKRAFLVSSGVEAPVSLLATPAEAVGLLGRLAGYGSEQAHAIRFRRCDGSEFDATAHVISLVEEAPAQGYVVVLRSLLSGGSHGEQILMGHKLDAALDTIPEGFAIFDREDDRLIMFNKAFRDRCGPAKEAVRVGVTLESIIRENIRLGVYTGIAEGTPEAESWVQARLADHRDTGSNGIVFQYADGRWMRSESHLTETGQIVALRIDVTDVKRAERALAEQAVELQRKNQALNQFNATVSHDLKAPLRHISMFSEMMCDDIRNDRLSDLATYADHIRQSTVRMQRLVESLLEYSQIAYRIASVRRVSLQAVVSEALQLLEEYIREAEAVVDVGRLPEVDGDPELLKRLAQNLIGNALKYCHEGKKPEVRIYGRDEGESVEFIVEDEGIGIDPRYADKIFDVFQRLHRDESVYKGTGVGLSLVKRIAESHDGEIRLDTNYGPGARFVVTFPKRFMISRERF
ncbi:MAG: ATP-binding protein [Shinella sp.]|nr:ATP-binding protein [Shinella sp.]